MKYIAIILVIAAGLAPTVSSIAYAQTSDLTSGTISESDKKTLCLAIGHSFRARAGQTGDKIKDFDVVFSAPDADELKIRQDLSDLQTQLGQMADAMERYFSDAEAPSQVEQETVDSLPLKDLFDASSKCMA